MSKIVLVIDDYDSFSNCIAHMIAEMGASPVLVRSSEITLSAIERISPDAIIISSKSNRSDGGEADLSIKVIREYGLYTPILGVGSGFLAVSQAYGAELRRARRIMHGRTSQVVILNETPLFKDLPRSIRVIRYDTLVVDRAPGDLIVDAISLDDGEVMALHHSKHPVYALLFHPESVGTEYGDVILRNFLELV